jgi:hypothetical protein
MQCFKSKIINKKIMRHFHPSEKILVFFLIIVESPMCVYSRDYETIEHLMWGTERFGDEKSQLWIEQLTLSGEYQEGGALRGAFFPEVLQHKEKDIYN